MDLLLIHHSSKQYAVRRCSNNLRKLFVVYRTVIVFEIIMAEHSEACPRSIWLLQYYTVPLYGHRSVHQSTVERWHKNYYVPTVCLYTRSDLLRPRAPSFFKLPAPMHIMESVVDKAWRMKLRFTQFCRQKLVFLEGRGEASKLKVWWPYYDLELYV